MQYRLSTLLLAFVVVWASLAVFGAAGLAVAAMLLVVAALHRSPEVRKHFLIVLLLVLCGLGLLPVVLAVQEEARIMERMSELPRIGSALLKYEQAHGHLPPAVAADRQGQATASWRVRILPYMEHPDEYKAYNFREPWNGPNNSKLVGVVAKFWCCPAGISTAGPPMTTYVAVTGPGTVWEDHCSTAKLPRVMVVEVPNSKINWMEPRDWTLEEVCGGPGDGSASAIFSRHVKSDGFLYDVEFTGAWTVRSDEQDCFLYAGLPPETLKGLFTGDAKAWEAYNAFQQAPQRRIHWANCTALAVLVLSYAVLLFRPRDRPPQTAPALRLPLKNGGFDPGVAQKSAAHAQQLGRDLAPPWRPGPRN